MLFMFSDASHKSCFAHMGTTNAFPWRQIAGQNVKRWEKWNYGSPRIIYTYMILLFPRRFLQDLRQLLEGYATPVSRNGRLLLFSLWSVHEAIHEAILPLRNTLCSESWNNEKKGPNPYLYWLPLRVSSVAYWLTTLTRQPKADHRNFKKRFLISSDFFNTDQFNQMISWRFKTWQYLDQCESRQIITFHQPIFPWNKGSRVPFPFQKATFWGSMMDFSSLMLWPNSITKL